MLPVPSIVFTALAPLTFHIFQLLALVVETLFFGASSLLYAISAWILLFRRRPGGRPTINIALFVTSTIMWILSLAVGLMRFSPCTIQPDSRPDSISHWTHTELFSPSSTKEDLQMGRSYSIRN